VGFILYLPFNNAIVAVCPLKNMTARVCFGTIGASMNHSLAATSKRVATLWIYGSGLAYITFCQAVAYNLLSHIIKLKNLDPLKAKFGSDNSTCQGIWTKICFTDKPHSCVTFCCKTTTLLRRPWRIDYQMYQSHHETFKDKVS